MIWHAQFRGLVYVRANNQGRELSKGFVVYISKELERRNSLISLPDGANQWQCTYIVPKFISSYLTMEAYCNSQVELQGLHLLMDLLITIERCSLSLCTGYD